MWPNQMKKQFWFYLLLSSCLFAQGNGLSVINIASIRSDFRLAAVEATVVEQTIKAGALIVDPTGLVRHRPLLEKLDSVAFGLNYQAVGKGVSLSSALEAFLTKNRTALGSFYKPESTVVKVFKKKSIKLYFAYEALASAEVMEAGDVIMLQDLGDLF